MRISIVSFGKKRDELYGAALAEYLGRIKRPWSLACQDLPSGRKSEDESADNVMRRELHALDEARITLESCALLDVHGKAHSSESFATWLEQLQDGGTRELAFVIGGADGVHPDGRRRARHKLSLSPLTLPHRLARVLLAEQIFRAQTILRGEKYHRR